LRTASPPGNAAAAFLRDTLGPSVLHDRLTQPL
jgi:hypothetical protein